MEFENQVKPVKRIIMLLKESKCRTSFILDGQKIAISSRLSSRYQVDPGKAVFIPLIFNHLKWKPSK